MKAIIYNRSQVTRNAWKLFKASDITWNSAMFTSWAIYKRKLFKRLLRYAGKVAFVFIKKSTGLPRFAIGSTKQEILVERDALSKDPNYTVPMKGIVGIQSFYDHTIDEWRKFDWEYFDKILYIEGS